MIGAKAKYIFGRLINLFQVIVDYLHDQVVVVA